MTFLSKFDFLSSGVTSACLNMGGTQASWRLLFTIDVTAGVTSATQFFMSQVGMASNKQVLLGEVVRILEISSVVAG